MRSYLKFWLHAFTAGTILSFSTGPTIVSLALVSSLTIKSTRTCAKTNLLISKSTISKGLSTSLWVLQMVTTSTLTRFNKGSSRCCNLWLLKISTLISWLKELSKSGSRNLNSALVLRLTDAMKSWFRFWFVSRKLRKRRTSLSISCLLPKYWRLWFHTFNLRVVLGLIKLWLMYKDSPKMGHRWASNRQVLRHFWTRLSMHTYATIPSCTMLSSVIKESWAEKRRLSCSKISCSNLDNTWVFSSLVGILSQSVGSWRSSKWSVGNSPWSKRSALTRVLGRITILCLVIYFLTKVPSFRRHLRFNSVTISDIKWLFLPLFTNWFGDMNSSRLRNLQNNWTKWVKMTKLSKTWVTLRRRKTPSLDKA